MLPSMSTRMNKAGSCSIRKYPFLHPRLGYTAIQRLSLPFAVGCRKRLRIKRSRSAPSHATPTTMNRELRFSPEAIRTLKELESTSAKAVLKQVRKTLGLLETNLRHPSLQTHQYRSLRGPKGEEVFEAYAQNRTPGAYRVFFYYGPDRVEGKRRVAVLTVFAITPHP